MHITYLRKGKKGNLDFDASQQVGYQSAVQDMQIKDTLLVIITFRIAEFQKIFWSYIINLLIGNTNDGFKPSLVNWPSRLTVLPAKHRLASECAYMN